MNCSQVLNGIAKDCSGSLGGLQKVYIANKNDIVSITLDSSTTTEISSIEMASGKTFHEYAFRKGNASATSNLTVDESTIGQMVETDITLTFLKQETQKRIEMNALSMGDLAIIALDNDGIYKFYGYDFPVHANGGTGESGAQFTDGSKYTITLHDTSMLWPYNVKVAPATTGDTDYVNIATIVAS